MKSSLKPFFWLPLIFAAAISSCSRSQATIANNTEDTKAAGAGLSRKGKDTSGIPLLNLSYDKPAVVGTKVHATVSHLAPGSKVDLAWGTVNGGWVVEGYYKFKGKKFEETETSLGQFTVDANGQFDASFALPEDYGGVHEVTAKIDGKPVAQNGIDLTQSFEFSPASGPVGTPVQVKVKGLGWRTMESTWVVNWDNNVVGWVSAVNTRGSATARFRATGPIGDHVIKMYTGWQGQSYLNFEQSPVADLPRPTFKFRTTAGTMAQKDYAEPYQKAALPQTELHLEGAKLVLAPTQGPVGTRAMLRGDGFPKGATLQLQWETYVGSRVSGNGFASDERVIGEAKVGSDGKLVAPIEVPDDLGGLHTVVVKRGEEELARVPYVIETSIVSMTPMSGPAGTPVTIHLKGVGWTEYDNLYATTYDNAYMGYVCGFNSQGDVVVNFIAAGDVGPHLIDFFPGIYQGPATEPQQLYRSPQLTYFEDHPGDKLPALHFTFEVTPSGSRSSGTTD